MPRHHSALPPRHQRGVNGERTPIHGSDGGGERFRSRRVRRTRHSPRHEGDQQQRNILDSHEDQLPRLVDAHVSYVAGTGLVARRERQHR
jgi:hypothetical protein